MVVNRLLLLWTLLPALVSSVDVVVVCRGLPAERAEALIGPNVGSYQVVSALMFAVATQIILSDPEVAPNVFSCQINGWCSRRPVSLAFLVLRNHCLSAPAVPAFGMDLCFGNRARFPSDGAHFEVGLWCRDERPDPSGSALWIGLLALITT